MEQESEKPRGQTITVTQAGALLNRTPRWVQNLVAAGFISKSSRGAYTVVEVVRGALAYYEDQLSRTSKAAAANRATEARTREIELRIAERKRELIPVDEARAVVSEMAAMVRAEFAGLPAKFTRDLDERRRLEQEIDGSFERLAAAAGRASASLGSDIGAVDAEPEA
jgi:restriction endonuclease Mrr